MFMYSFFVLIILVSGLSDLVPLKKETTFDFIDFLREVALEQTGSLIRFLILPLYHFLPTTSYRFIFAAVFRFLG